MKVLNWRFVLFLLMFSLLSAGCSVSGNHQQKIESPQATDQIELLISAAASLTDALEELEESFAQAQDEIRLTYNFGGSGPLARQIEQGAPVDIFLSASQQDMDILQDKGLILDASRVDFARNELVLITSQNSGLDMVSFEEMKAEEITHFAIGDPQSVPAGRYTKEVLENIDLWAELESKLVFGSDVRQVLTYVESGNAELGVVYATDALFSDQVKVLAVAEESWHTPIVYPGAVVKGTKQKEAAEQFLSYLTSEEGKAILAKYGFK